ncbi:molecular chaperone OsmY [Oceanisphaera sp. W20_SRM_FM3]|uniref:molecular chaperone OsmY n=1 Tax=Oceanisphaera sp. W20_SRM_FM3 TaxID=3240267 RepID=UPI003F9A6CB5
MKKITFSPSMIAVVLSSVLAGGSAFAADSVSETTNTISTKAESAVERTGDTLSQAAEATKGTIDDAMITTKVKGELLKHDAINSGDISVETTDAVVTLSGFVTSQEQIKQAAEIAGQVEGVASVSDKLIVKDKAYQSVKEYADDAMVTSAVKAKFLAADGVPGLSVSVETQDGVVQLTGEVDTQAQATHAENVAKSVDGVQSVKNDLIVTQ